MTSFPLELITCCLCRPIYKGVYVDTIYIYLAKLYYSPLRIAHMLLHQIKTHQHMIKPKQNNH